MGALALPPCHPFCNAENALSLPEDLKGYLKITRSCAILSFHCYLIIAGVAFFCVRVKARRFLERGVDEINILFMRCQGMVFSCRRKSCLVKSECVVRNVLVHDVGEKSHH